MDRGTRALAGLCAIVLAASGSPVAAGAQSAWSTTAAATDPAPAGPSAGAPSTPPDPLVEEPPGEAAPDTDVTVPAPDEDPDGAAGGAGGGVAGGAAGGGVAGDAAGGAAGDAAGAEEARRLAEVLRARVLAAEAGLAAARKEHQVVVDRLAAARLHHAELADQLQALGAGSEAAAREVAIAEARLQARAVAAFVSSEAAASAVIGSFEASNHDSVLDLASRRVLLGAALDQDELAIEAYLELRARLDRQVLSTLDGLRAIDQAISGLAQEADRLAADVDRAIDELEAFRAGSAIYIAGVVFPVAEPYERPLIDSWGFPRMPGTPDEHRHQGIDIFAPAGTPLLAAERSVVTRAGSGRLGGLTVWLRGESGTDWYYAHLQSHQPGLASGQVVEAGDVVGYVGNTGNAVSTPPHLHLEIHPGGGEPVNPYPLLNVVAERRSG
jgi:murein DD-endopeptidase MepM/ murein hydrolase activator NlpD